MMSNGLLLSSKSLYFAIVASPPPDTNCWANCFEDSALNTSLEINVMAIDMLSLLTYLRLFRVR